jgi:RimJ/RimL family protein N-acetyltransferase
VDLGDLALLRIEMGVLWNLDVRGRIREPVDIAIGIAADGMTAAVGQHVPDDVAANVLPLAAPPPGEPPELLREMQTADLVLSGGPSYYVDKPLEFAVGARIIRSDDPRANTLHNKRPGNWEPDEWLELVNGGTGAPWAMVLHGNRVVSICHTPRRTPHGAEAGTWTDPEFRGRGYAAATTAAWADMLSLHRFYSTSAENNSSQHVAERLGLRPIGWIWKISRATSRAAATPRQDGESARG